ncbi:Hypothetical protein SMAX5B_021323 [Scophthalmus maximus]|uniref:Uncharacterized protein n=1 Tax=Scophthalmus maximus TaxID=52904 RepID=A0A2U9B3D5_SCOMX|nr:Hypothetical protein SMAX5B_021323 [Scophthalmus maximus]
MNTASCLSDKVLQDYPSIHSGTAEGESGATLHQSSVSSFQKLHQYVITN